MRKHVRPASFPGETALDHRSDRDGWPTGSFPRESRSGNMSTAYHRASESRKLRVGLPEAAEIPIAC